jgi:peptidoglycan/LPS O-acetylase OafA/YrhL
LGFFKSESSIAEKGSYLSFIDGLRGIAILLVLAVHSSEAVQGVFGNYRFKSMTDFFASGARGVQLFFIISAFTLFSSSKRRFDIESKPYLSFYIRRAFRILPFWWLTNLVYLFISHRSFASALPNFLMYFGFIRYKPGVEMFPYGWTIFVEETFYLFLPLLFIFIKDIYRAFAFFFFMFVVHYLWLGRLSVWMGFPDQNAFYMCFPLAQWFYFAIGIILYFLMNGGFFRGSFLEDRKAQSLMTVATLIFTYYFFVSKDYVLAAIPLTLLFVSGISPVGFIGRLVRTPVLIHFGRYCYSIYLSHGLIVAFAMPLLQKIFRAVGFVGHPAELSFVAFFTLLSAMCFVTGSLFFNGIEKPFVNLGKKVIRKFVWGP